MKHELSRDSYEFKKDYLKKHYLNIFVARQTKKYSNIVFMALFLNAEQKDLLKIFKIEEQYIIPPYQRPYSWEYDQCFQLYSDIMAAFRANKEYFIGNIIIAQGENNKDFFEVVDGQQRLITLLLLLKVFSLYAPEMKILDQSIKKEDWEGIGNEPRILSEIFEAQDGDNLRKVLAYDLDAANSLLNKLKSKQGKLIEDENYSRIDLNFLWLFSWVDFFVTSDGELKKMIEFTLKKVFLLPIQLSGRTQDEANERALVIFETINNRGMNLEDADIFKAMLYNKAKNIGEENIFIEQWREFKNLTADVNLNIDDVFRFYSHIIRGKEGITSSETNLREFFTRENFSPIELKKYRDSLNDLFKILEVHEILNKEKVSTSAVAKWLQVVDAYTNQYPKFAIVNYLFVNGLQIDGEFERFLKSLVRYIYYQGATSTVKFEIYNIIKQISLSLPVSDYFIENIPDFHFNFLGRLKKGFALLAFYLNRNEAMPTYHVDKIISLKDQDYLSGDWTQIDIESIVDDLGNIVVLDIPKKNIPFNKKAEYFSLSQIPEVKTLLAENKFTVEDFEKRSRLLKENLTKFFTGV